MVYFLQRWKLVDTELMKILEEHKSFELENAKSLKSIIDMTDSSIVTMFLGGIMLDSTKHANIIQAIMDVDAGTVLWNIDKQKLNKKVSEHIEIEKKMIKSIETIMGKNKNEKIKPLIKEILEDERRHHLILTQLIKNIETLDVLKEQWIDLYVRFQQEDFGRT